MLATDGPALDLVWHVPAAQVRIVDDPRRFRDLLLAERPRVVVCSQPPAGAEDLALVASERRRRAGMRAVHIAPAESGVERLEALGMGFDDALSSMTPAAELAGRLALLEARARLRPESGPVVHVGDDLELDLAAHELRRNGELVHLRPKEFGLLATLAARPGVAHTRRLLLERVWGAEHGGPRTVDVHVRWLRSKIELDPANPTRLLTVRGVGYRLDDGQR